MIFYVLSMGLPALVGRWGAKVLLFYCHFPDKYLVQDYRYKNLVRDGKLFIDFIL